MSSPPLIAHVIFNLGVGGMENGLVNLINQIPVTRYRHVIVCLKGYSDFRLRIQRPDVEVIALNKQEGQDWGLYLRLYQTLKRLNPDLVHTRNLAAMEAQGVAALLGIRARVHSEHGRDIYDVDGKNWKHRLLRRMLSRFPHHFIALSQDLAAWLNGSIGVPQQRISQIYNGVDQQKFRPNHQQVIADAPAGFFNADTLVIGSVGRMAAIKNYPSLIEAFILLCQRFPAELSRLRLMIVGDGVDRQPCLELLRQAGLLKQVWLPGERQDIAALLSQMDVMVLPSLNEGISNTILEAMASGIPVVATAVGGNVELVQAGVTGQLVPVSQPVALADALQLYLQQPALLSQHGQAARQRIEQHFSMQVMVDSYLSVYDRLLTTGQ